MPWNKGLKMGPEFSQKMSAAKKGKPLSLANRAALSRARKLLVGEKAPRWNGGITVDKNGYLLKHSPDHPHAKTNGYVSLHRIIAEKAIGRFLKPTEVVHHVNGIKSDNRNSNLVICQDESYHKLLGRRAKCRAQKAKEASISGDEPSVGARPSFIIDPFKEIQS